MNVIPAQAGTQVCIYINNLGSRLRGNDGLAAVTILKYSDCSKI
jgi:hypothetical protein